MRCAKVEKLKEKYDLRELDFFTKKAFENHIKKCPKCKIKYGSLLVLGVILGSSQKIYSPNFVKLFFSASLIKYPMIGFFMIGTATVINHSYTQRIVKIERKYQEERTEINEHKVFVGKDEKEMRKSKSKKGIRIIAKEKEKEIEIYFDKDYKIKSRIEK